MTFEEAKRQAFDKMEAIQEAFRNGEFDKLDRLADELEQAKEQMVTNSYSQRQVIATEN